MSEGIDLSDLKRRMDGAITTAFKSDIASLRTGREHRPTCSIRSWSESLWFARTAEPGGQYYGSGSPDARCFPSGTSRWSTLSICAIRESNLGLNPIVDGQNLRIPLPELNERAPQVAGQGRSRRYGEKAKVAVRNVRRDGMDSLKKSRKGWRRRPGRQQKPVRKGPEND